MQNNLMMKNNIKILQATSDTLDLYVYGYIESDGWWEESETSQNYFKKILEENQNVKQINLYVNSQGGSVMEAMGIRALLRRHKAKVTAYVDGWAASAASFILTAADEVVMDEASMQMIHNAWVFVAGNASELRKQADDLDKIMEGNRQAYLDKAGDKLTEEQLIEIMDAETWLTANECLELGLCDTVGSFNKPEAIDEVNELIEGDNITKPIQTDSLAVTPGAISSPAALDQFGGDIKGDFQADEPRQSDTSEDTDENLKQTSTILTALIKAVERKR